MATTLLYLVVRKKLYTEFFCNLFCIIYHVFDLLNADHFLTRLAMAVLNIFTCSGHIGPITRTKKTQKNANSAQDATKTPVIIIRQYALS